MNTKIYNVYWRIGGSLIHVSSFRTRKGAERGIATMCKDSPETFKKSKLKINVGYLYD